MKGPVLPPGANRPGPALTCMIHSRRIEGRVSPAVYEKSDEGSLENLEKSERIQHRTPCQRHMKTEPERHLTTGGVRASASACGDQGDVMLILAYTGLR